MKATAWVIDIAEGFYGAVGEFELIHILPDNPQLFKIPKTPEYCQQVFIWQNRIIPVLNPVTKLLNMKEQGKIIAIFAYKPSKTNYIEYGALFINNTPHRIEVSDEQAVPLPTVLKTWSPYIKCCFQETITQNIIPILKIAQLFEAQDLPKETDSVAMIKEYRSN